MSNKDIAIKVSHLKKSFRIPLEPSNGIKQKLINTLKGRKGYRNFTPLKDVSFEIKKGDFFGIVGRNGSGKSTLLKTIAGIYSPTGGTVQVNGSLVPFIELGVGFNPELTGRENVFLNGALLGFSHDEMETMYDDIVDFAELHDFMDERLKNYSSGMQVRLAFSIAIRAQGDVLLLDEVLAVGDEAFQKKCYKYFAELKKLKKTVILVTHDMDAVQRFCNEAVMIEKGSVVARGNSADVAQSYREMFVNNSDNLTLISKKTRKNIKAAVTAETVLKDNRIKIHVEVVPKVDMPNSILSLFLDRDTGEQVYRFSSDEKTGVAYNFKKDKIMTVDIELQNIFPNGTFSLRASIKSVDRSHEYISVGNLDNFEIDRRLEKGASQWDIHWHPQEQYHVDGKLYG